MRKFILLTALLFASPAFAQSSLTVTGEFGPGYLGFRSPHMRIGAEFSQTFLGRFTSTTEFSATPDQKTFAKSGHGFGLGQRITMHVTGRVSIRTGVGYSVYWSGIPSGSNCPPGNQGPNGPDGQQCLTTYAPYHKGGVNPYVGVEIRYALADLPNGVLTVDYLPKFGGCVWATADNPCPITSPRMEGIIAEQYFEMVPRFSFGVRGGWVRYGDQVNPYAPELWQKRHNAWFTTGVLRYELWRRS